MTVQRLIEGLSAEDIRPDAIVMLWSSQGKQVPAATIELGHMLLHSQEGFVPVGELINAVFINPQE
jgi:hypothetical protein